MRSLCLDDRKTATLIWLGLLTLVLALAAVNRLSPVPILREPFVDALRLCDILVLFVFAPLAVWMHWQLLKTVSGARVSFSRILFILGVYCLGVGFGMHEPMNALSLRAVHSPALRESIRFFDNGLGHWVFFGGFMLGVLAVVWAEAFNPLPEPMGARAAAGTLILGMVIGFIVFMNMYREDTVVDVAVLGATMILTLAIWRPGRTRPWRRVPLTAVTVCACIVGVVPTLLFWAIMK